MIGADQRVKAGAVFYNNNPKNGEKVAPVFSPPEIKGTGEIVRRIGRNGKTSGNENLWFFISGCNVVGCSGCFVGIFEKKSFPSTNILIDCIEADIPLLLGVEDFLKHFELTINYPEKLITLRWD